MEKKAIIKLSASGLGDKLMDIVGFYVICKCLGYNPKINFNNYINIFAWGVSEYDLRLFDFKNIELTNDEGCPFYIHSKNPSSSLCPYKAFEFVFPFLPNLTFESFSSLYHECAKEIIHPSNIILSKLPVGLEKAYGIHLRRTDKISTADIRHENTNTEFNIITQKLIEDIQNIIQIEEDPVFLIVSEDNEWKDEFHHIVNRIFIDNNKVAKFISIDYNSNEHYINYNGILDMFCLSRCKSIFQGVKYSTFSMIASLIGNNTIYNYSHFTESHDICLIHTYHSAIQINGWKNFDIELQKKITAGIQPLESNICLS